MKISALFRALLVAGLLASGGHAAETPVAITSELKGAWVVPDKDWDGRAVLLFHGMAADMDDAGDILKHLAQGLAAKGIASLRINFRGEGERLGTKITSTFTSRLEDAAAARDWVRGQPGVDAKRIGAQGFSLGGPTAVVTAGRHPDWFKSIAVWSSPSGDLFAMMASDAIAQRALRDGEATEEIPGWKMLTTKRDFYESFRGVDFDQALMKYPGAFLTIRGSGDHIAHRDDELMKIAPGRPAAAVLIGGADHIFNVFQPELGHAEHVLELTLAWFERTL